MYEWRKAWRCEKTLGRGHWSRGDNCTTVDMSHRWVEQVLRHSRTARTRHSNHLARNLESRAKGVSEVTFDSFSD